MAMAMAATVGPAFSPRSGQKATRRGPGPRRGPGLPGRHADRTYGSQRQNRDSACAFSIDSTQSSIGRPVANSGEYRLIDPALINRPDRPTQLASQILSGNYRREAAPKRRLLTIVLSDIVEFTRACETLPGQAVEHVRNRYLSEMVAIADRHGGRVTQIGINTGEASVGDFGSAGRKLYSGIGLASNLAERLRSHCEPGEMLMSGSTHGLVQNDISGESRGEIRVRGSSRPLQVRPGASARSWRTKEAPLSRGFRML